MYRLKGTCDKCFGDFHKWWKSPISLISLFFCIFLFSILHAVIYSNMYDREYKRMNDSSDAQYLLPNHDTGVNHAIRTRRILGC